MVPARKKKNEGVLNPFFFSFNWWSAHVHKLSATNFFAREAKTKQYENVLFFCFSLFFLQLNTTKKKMTAIECVPGT